MAAVRNVMCVVDGFFWEGYVDLSPAGRTNSGVNHVRDSVAAVWHMAVCAPVADSAEGTSVHNHVCRGGVSSFIRLFYHVLVHVHVLQLGRVWRSVGT